MIYKIYTEILTAKYNKILENANERICIITNEIDSFYIKKTILEKCKENVSLILITNAQFKDKIFINKLKKLGASIKFIETTDDKNSIIDSPICVVDINELTIGSYGFENLDNKKSIINIFDDNELVSQFYNSIFTLSSLLENTYDIGKDIINRLNLISDTIEMGDEELTIFQIEKLKEKVKSNTISESYNLQRIFTEIENENYLIAKDIISEIVNSTDKLMHVSDIESIILDLEAKSLELQIYAIDNDILELQKTIHNFERTYNSHMNDSMLKLLKLRIEKLEKMVEKDPSLQAELDEAKKDLENFLNNIDFEKTERIFIINDDKKKELKKNFREATKLCHPDRISDEQKNDATAIFIQLQIAYRANDLETVKKLLEQLRKGFFIPKLRKITKKDILRSNILNLKIKRDDMQKEYVSIKNEKSTEIISDIDNWTKYFEDKISKINTEIQKYESDIKNNNLSWN